MTQLNQLGGHDVLSVTVKNYSGSDIAAGLAVILDTSNTPAGSGTAPLGVTLPASDVKPFGITITSIPASKTGRVRVLGSAPVTCSATVHVGDVVMCDSAGKVLAQTSGKYQIGQCMSEGVNGDLVLVLISTAKNA